MSATVLNMAGKVDGAGGEVMFASNPELARQYAAEVDAHRVLAQEVHIGTINELVPPDDHIGLSIAPWLDVATDDVVFDYLKGAGTGMAPARSSEAEAELWTEEEFFTGQGRASIIDWSEKNHYDASDIQRYREAREVMEATVGRAGNIPLYTASMKAGFEAKLARHTRMRKTRLDNRIEWLNAEALSKGVIAYADGKIKFRIDFRRPANQQNQAPVSGSYASNTHDPINDLLAMQSYMKEVRGVTIVEALCSRDFLNSLYKSRRFQGLTGFAPGSIDAADMNYLMPGWGPQAAIDIVSRETGINFRMAEGTMRVQVPGTASFTTTRFFPRNQVIFLPDRAEIDAISDTDLGFAKTVSSPHPANNWAPGFYAWEKEFGVDPWGLDIGSGVKAMPIYPHMDKTYTWQVDLPAPVTAAP